MTSLPHNSISNNLNILFYKEGFSFSVSNDVEKNPKVSHFKVTHRNRWEEEVQKELETNLKLIRNFQKVYVGMISSFYNLVPNVFMNGSLESLLNFSEAEFEENILLENKTSFENTFVFGTSQHLVDQLKKIYGENVEFYHSGKVFLDTLEKSENPVIHLNLNQRNLEIAVTNNLSLQFYNIFETLTGEDVLFYTLFVLEQLKLDSNQVEMKTYGQLLPKTKVFQILKKYVRNINTAQKDEESLENFTLYNLTQCGLSQEISEEKK